MPWWLVPSSPTRPARSTARRTGASFWQTSWTVWSKARCRNVEYRATTGRIPPRARPVAKVTACCSAMPTSKTRSGNVGGQLRHAGPGRHAGGDADDAPVGAGQLDELVGEDRGVVGRLLPGPARRSATRRRRPSTRSASPVPRASCVSARGASVIGGRAAPWKPIWSVSAGRNPRPFWVRTWTIVGPGRASAGAERLVEGVQVVPGHDPDVGQAEVLEQLSRLGQLDDGGAQPPRPLEQRATDHRHLLDRAVVGALALLPGARQLDLRQVLRERPDRRADRHLVVVDDDEHLRLALADVVEGLERQTAHQRGVADDDRDPLQPVAQVARLGQALGDRQAGPGVAAVEHVVLRLGAARETADRRPAGEACRSDPVARSGACAGRPGGRCPRRSGRAATRAVDAGRSSARRRRATSRGGRPVTATVRMIVSRISAASSASWRSSMPRRSAGPWRSDRGWSRGKDAPCDRRCQVVRRDAQCKPVPRQVACFCDASDAPVS